MILRVRFAAWWVVYGLWVLVATTGPRRANGERWTLGVARWLHGIAQRVWHDSFADDGW